MKIGIATTFGMLLIAASFCSAIEERASIVPNHDGQSILSTPNDRGDRVPDFSYCGYQASEVATPQIAVKFSLKPSMADDTDRIQAALDQLAAAPIRDDGWRGAVVLEAGRYKISKTLRLHGDHVVLRGTRLPDGSVTTLVVNCPMRNTALIVGARAADQSRNSSQHEPQDSQRSSAIVERVSVGDQSITVDSAAGWQVGQAVRIAHPSTQQWIEAVGMNSFPSDDGKGSWLDWKSQTMDLQFPRFIVAISENKLTLDAPLTNSIDPGLTQGQVISASQPLHHHLGVENIQWVSEVKNGSSGNPKTEDHAWDAVRLDCVRDAWARDLHFSGFAGSAVNVGRSASRISVIDCQSIDPVSEDAGWRRNTFYCVGSQSLFLRCTAENGRHDFSTGPLTTGPNAFVYCSAKQSTQFSGPIGSWCTGVLLDNVQIDGGGIVLANHQTKMAGTGWAAANCVMWNCVAPWIECYTPPIGFNIAIGIWGEVAGDGTWRSLNEFVSPNSLFAAQLRQRCGDAVVETVLRKSEYLDSMMGASGVSLPSQPVLSEPMNVGRTISPTKKQLGVSNGWLTIDNQLATGQRQSLSWWRGNINPTRAQEFGASLTRFVPGDDGRLFTNSVSDLVAQMHQGGRIALEHHWGLWYDRRRDDHQMVRRMDGDVWPPFYEQPWSRSGRGKAWDGLSRYDLNSFNPWYFDRLSQFADLAGQEGLILMQYMYFQHNILEAGAHWADFPRRPANCLQDTGFDEPPIYENRKRVFMAEPFYDVAHPVRRELHTNYIRHCLDTLGQYPNVIFTLGEEYTGPAHFVRFWLDVINQWMQESGREVVVMLSVCRDVQEEILAEPRYAGLIDVIDVKYWWHTPEGKLYEPAGGQNLAPRQQLRSWKGPKSKSSESLCRSVREMRLRFPDKAVICSVAEVNPWMLLAAGGSLPSLPRNTDSRVLNGLVDYLPQQNGDDLALCRGPDQRFWVSKKQPLMAADKPVYEVDPHNGRLETRRDSNEFSSEPNLWILWSHGSN